MPDLFATILIVAIIAAIIFGCWLDTKPRSWFYPRRAFEPRPQLPDEHIGGYPSGWARAGQLPPPPLRGELRRLNDHDRG